MQHIYFDNYSRSTILDLSKSNALVTHFILIMTLINIFSTCTNPIIHLFYSPKICIGIVLDYSWDMFMSQEKLQTMSMQNFGGVKEVHYGIVQVVNIK